MTSTSGRTRVLGAVFSLLLCLAVPLSLAQNSVAEPTEYVSNITNMPQNLMFTSVVADGGSLYVIGGLVDDIYGTSTALDTVYIYDIATGDVKRGANMPVGACWSHYAKGTDGNIYIFGGFNDTLGYIATTQIYDISGNSWSTGTNCPASLGGGASVTVANGTVVILGTYPSDSTTTFLYDPVGDSWAYMADQPVDVGARRAAYWDETAIYVMGGTDSGVASNSAYLFNPVANTWTPVASMPYAAMMGGAVTGLNGVVYHIGGVDGMWADMGPQLWQIQKYDPATDTWSESTISSFNPARSGFGCAVDEYGRIFGVGGYDGGSVVPTVTMIVPANLVFDQLEIVAPNDGDTVDGVVTVSVSYSTPNIGMPVIDLFVDGVFLDSQTAPWFSSTVSFTWDTTGLLPGSSHVVTARGTLWNGEMREDSVTVTVTDQSVEEIVASLQQQIADLQTQQSNLLAAMDALNASLHQAIADSDASLIAYLDVQLAGLNASIAAVNAVQMAMIAAMEESNESMMAYLDAQLAVLGGALAQIGAVQLAMIEGMNATNASTMAYLNSQMALLGNTLAQIGAGLSAMGLGQAAAMDDLNATLVDLQLQLDDFKEQIDRVENKADTAGIYGIVTLVLVVIIVALVAMMFMMARKKP